MRLLPFPGLSSLELDELTAHAGMIAATLQCEQPIERALAFREARGALDELAFEILGASRGLQEIVRSELIRVA